MIASTAGTGPAELGRSSAPVAQLVEQRIRNAKVGGSTPSWGTKQTATWRAMRRSCSKPATESARPQAEPQAASVKPRGRRTSCPLRSPSFRQRPPLPARDRPVPTTVAASRVRDRLRPAATGSPCSLGTLPCPMQGPVQSVAARRSLQDKLRAERHFVDVHRNGAPTLRAEFSQERGSWLLAPVARDHRGRWSKRGDRLGALRRQGPSEPAKEINARRRFERGESNVQTAHFEHRCDGQAVAWCRIAGSGFHRWGCRGTEPGYGWRQLRDGFPPRRDERRDGQRDARHLSRADRGRLESASGLGRRLGQMVRGADRAGKDLRRRRVRSLHGLY